MTDKTLGAYKRTTPDPDETTGEVLARLQAEMARLLDEADGGVTAALIEQEVEQPAAEVRELRSALARELARGNALQDALDAAEPRPLTADDISEQMVERGARQYVEEEYVSWRRAPENVKDNARESVRGILRAALTEPTRPEGAEEIEALLAGSWPIDREGLSAAADDLAMNGVRVVGEERS